MSTTEIKYTKEHEWVRIDNDIAYIGITEFAQGELGDIVFVDLPSVGKQVQQANTLCVVESTKAASDVYAPISGTVVEVNSELNTSPALVNKDPLGEGWMVKLKDFNRADLDKLMSLEQYNKLIQK
jgi:glycine cleavage system H protein